MMNERRESMDIYALNDTALKWFVVSLTYFVLYIC